MNNKKTNTLSIIGFIVSIFSLIFGTIICLISLSQIKETNEKGKGFALGGILINVLKVMSIIILAILYIFIPGANETEYKCKHSNNCEYHSESQTYTCTYDNDGVEEYITCDASIIDTDKPTSSNDGTEDDPDFEDTFDYDAEY